MANKKILFIMSVTFYKVINMQCLRKHTTSCIMTLFNFISDDTLHIIITTPNLKAWEGGRQSNQKVIEDRIRGVTNIIIIIACVRDRTWTYVKITEQSLKAFFSITMTACSPLPICAEKEDLVIVHKLIRSIPHKTRGAIFCVYFCRCPQQRNTTSK